MELTKTVILENLEFFENCAKEYGRLGRELIEKFIKEFGIEPYDGIPLRKLNPWKGTNYCQGGRMPDWEYFFHGNHCKFRNIENGQEIEIELIFGDEFGVLDPYFFSRFIETTPYYKPLPIEFKNSFQDGNMILQTMEEEGKLERIESNIKGRFGVVVKDRAKSNIEVFVDSTYEIFKEYSMLKN